MSIVLRTDPKLPFGECVWKDADHDCKAAHATDMALEEFRLDTLEDFYTADQIVNYIKSRAAANLARLMGEENG